MNYIGVPPLTKAERNVIDHNVVDGQSTYQASYTPGFLDVYLNGVLLQSDEYIATSGTDFTLGAPTQTGDTLTTVAWGTFETASVAPGSIGNSHLQPDSVNSSNIQDGSIVSVDLNVAQLQAAGLLPTAWVSFEGATTNILGSYNVASVTSPSTGLFSINFATPLDNAGISVVASASLADTTANERLAMPYTVSTTSVGVKVTNAATAFRSDGRVFVQVFGGKA